MSIDDTLQCAIATRGNPRPATRVPGPDFDYLRTFARQAGHENTSAAVVRFAVIELARGCGGRQKRAWTKQLRP
jgi:hypothetical protein